MIRRVHFVGFRALKDVWLDLTPFTVLVGPNASGKTSIFEALQSESNLNGNDGWRRSAQPEVTIEMDAGERYVRRPGAGPLSLPTSIVNFDLAQMRPARTVVAETELDRVGSNLVNVYASLPRAVQTEIATELSRLVPSIGDVHYRPSAHAGTHRLVFRDRWQDSVWYEPTQVSDGTVFTLAYLVLRATSRHPRLICVEEPERSLHPYLLRHVVELLRSLTQGERAIQVLVATQSAELLEHVEPAEVRFLGRNIEGNVEVRSAPIDEPGWDEAVREYSGSMGQMWLSGGLGGVPAV